MPICNRHGLYEQRTLVFILFIHFTHRSCLCAGSRTPSYRLAKNFNVFSFYYQIWFIFVFVTPQLFIFSNTSFRLCSHSPTTLSFCQHQTTSIRLSPTATFAFVNTNLSPTVLLIQMFAYCSLFVTYFVYFFINSLTQPFLPAFSFFLQPCVSATQQPIPLFVFATFRQQATIQLIFF